MASRKEATLSKGSLGGQNGGRVFGRPDLSQRNSFLSREKDNGTRRSAVSGKKILLKLDKSKEDKAEENRRNELLKFLNSSFD
ncbi:hypothetical protein SDJN02_15023, partial [Cucurbita argyrosperma subsp. argyrosperma]